MNPLRPEALEQIKALTAVQVPALKTGYTLQASHRFGQFVGMATDQFQTASVLLYGEWAREESLLLESLIRPGDWVLDIGANTGSFSMAFAARVRDWQNPGRNGHVFSFEPQLHCFNCLVANVALNSLSHLVSPMRAAAGSASGEMDCPILDPWKENNFGGCTLVDKELYPNRPMESVPLLTVDSLQLPACHLIKCDVEGMEADALTGAYATISKYRPIVWTECLEFRLGSKKDLLKVFAEHDYKAWSVTTPLYSPRNIRNCAVNPYLNAKEEIMLDENILAIPKESEPPAWLSEQSPFRRVAAFE